MLQAYGLSPVSVPYYSPVSMPIISATDRFIGMPLLAAHNQSFLQPTNNFRTSDLDSNSDHDHAICGMHVFAQ